MRCDQFQNHLDSYLSGRCTTEETRAAEHHLERCAVCYVKARERRRLVEFLNQLGETDPPAGFHSRVMKAAEQQIAFERESVFESLLRPLEWWRMAGRGLRAATVTALALGLFLGGFLGPQLFNETYPVSTEIANVEVSTAQQFYGEDCLGGSPEGSLTESYLALVAEFTGQESDR